MGNSMKKKLMIDESYRLPHYARLVVIYKCGCSYYNDSWKSACESDPVCPVHEQPIKAESSETVRGSRPVKTETKRSSLKIN